MCNTFCCNNDLWSLNHKRRIYMHKTCESKASFKWPKTRRCIINIPF
jgi:hypothetical protein